MIVSNFKSMKDQERSNILLWVASKLNKIYLFNINLSLVFPYKQIKMTFHKQLLTNLGTIALCDISQTDYIIFLRKHGHYLPPRAISQDNCVVT